MKDWRSLPRKPRPDLAARNRASAKHGQTGTPTFKSWDAMRQRCLNPRCKDYANYGGRGITICDRWLASFAAFLDDMGERPLGQTLGRLDNNGNYEPSNCRWETPVEQNSNRRSTRTVTANGRTQTIAQWARELGTSRQTIRHRIEAGWSPEAIVDTHVEKRVRRT